MAGVDGIAARSYNASCDFIEVRETHEDHECLRGADFRPVDFLYIVTRDEGDNGSMIAMRQRNAGISGNAEGRGDAGHNLERDAGIRQGFGLFPAPPEQKRISALQAHDFEAALAAIDEQRADLFLRESVVGFFLAYVKAFGGGGRQIQQFLRSQMIVENCVRLFEQPLRLDGDEFRISWSSADQVDLAHTELSRAGSAS